MNWDQQIQGEEETDIETFETERSLEGMTGELPKRRSSRGRGVSLTKRQPTRLAFRKIPPRIRFPYSPWPGVTVIRDRYGNEPPAKTDKSSQEPGSSSSSPASGGASLNPDTAISEGSEYIRWVQNTLNNVLGLRLPLDGVIGPETRSAIRSFQQKQGLPVDGIVGPNTERALIAASGSQPSGASAEFGMFGTELANQEREEEVNLKSSDYTKWVQKSLNQIMGLRLMVDGVMGPQTRSAIRSFQQRIGLAADGVVGIRTEAALLAAGSTPPPSESRSPTGIPPDIVQVRGIRIARQIAPQVEALLAAAEADGIQLSGWGYRSTARQIELRKKHCGASHYDIWTKPSSQCTPPTARPGRSMHEKGLAIDFTYNGSGIDSWDNPGFQWMARNAARFGLKNLPSEPWHWSVNGQ